MGAGRTDQGKTIVVHFREFPETQELIAFFPLHSATVLDKEACLSYMNMGQHGAANLKDCLEFTEATDAHQLLLSELTHIYEEYDIVTVDEETAVEMNKYRMGQWELGIYEPR